MLIHHARTNSALHFVETWPFLQMFGVTFECNPSRSALPLARYSGNCDVLDPTRRERESTNSTPRGLREVSKVCSA